MSDPSTDKIGTVRQSPDGTIVVRAENESYPWMALNLDGPYCAPNEVVATWPVIGACPGTPAVEGRGMDDAAEVERLKADARVERAEANAQIEGLTAERDHYRRGVANAQARAGVLSSMLRGMARRLTEERRHFYHQNDRLDQLLTIANQDRSEAWACANRGRAENTRLRLELDRLQRDLDALKVGAGQSAGSAS